jgi:hypothetical protein
MPLFRKRIFIIWTAVAISICTFILISFLLPSSEYVKMRSIPPGFHVFDVNGPVPICGRWRDTMPNSRDPKAYRLYISARKLWRSKIEWQLSRQEAMSILHDIQAASDQGDWGARALLAYFYRSGLGPLDSNNVLSPNEDKSVEIVREAVAAGQAWGFYDLGVAHEHGYGGAFQDKSIAWAYYLKAAELGSPEAQMTLASAYQDAEREDAAEAMKQCAYKQGHGDAAYRLGLMADVLNNFAAAAKYYQAGTRFGSQRSAVALRHFFDVEKWVRRGKKEQDTLKGLALLPDAERERRYNEITIALNINPDLKLTKLDKVLPLPPAELPEWHGVEDAIEPETDAPPTY